MRGDSKINSLHETRQGAEPSHSSLTVKPTVFAGPLQSLLLVVAARASVFVPASAVALAGIVALVVAAVAASVVVVIVVIVVVAIVVATSVASSSSSSSSAALRIIVVISAAASASSATAVIGAGSTSIQLCGLNSMNQQQLLGSVDLVTLARDADISPFPVEGLEDKIHG